MAGREQGFGVYKEEGVLGAHTEIQKKTTDSPK